MNIKIIYKVVNRNIKHIRKIQLIITNIISNYQRIILLVILIDIRLRICVIRVLLMFLIMIK